MLMSCVREQVQACFASTDNSDVKRVTGRNKHGTYQKLPASRFQLPASSFQLPASRFHLLQLQHELPTRVGCSNNQRGQLLPPSRLFTGEADGVRTIAG